MPPEKFSFRAARARGKTNLKKILFPGEAGLLGRHVIAELERTGYEVRAALRKPLDRQRTALYRWSERVEQVQCDVLTGEGLAPACKDIDAIIHLAADMSGPDERKIAVALAGTRRLLGAVPGNGVRFILASSFSVYDWSRVGGELTEQSALLDAQTMDKHDGYTRAKVLQEQAARATCAQRQIALTVLRPATIWSGQTRGLACIGPRAGSATLVVGPRRLLRLTHVENCASAFAAALDERASGQTFNVDDGFPVTAWDFAAMTGSGLRLPMPYALAASCAGLAGGVLRPLLNGRAMPGLLVPERLRARFHPARAGHGALAAVLGWRPALSLAAGLSRT